MNTAETQSLARLYERKQAALEALSAGVQKGIAARVQKGTVFTGRIFRGFRASC